jgi:hypothetical protein
MARLTTKQYRFRKQDQIGNADAAHDDAFLNECFVDAGDLQVLADCADPRRILLGRTGTGKTALLQILRNSHDHVVEIKPEQLSLAFLSNDSILRNLMDFGVDLDLFFRLLWRHVFAIELIKERFRIRNESEKNSYFARMRERFSTNKKWERALRYLEEWSSSFWAATEYRVQEITTKLDSNIQSALGANYPLVSGEISASKHLTQEQRQELCEQAQKVVNEIQIRELFEIVELLRDELLDDPQYRIFLVIDGLDENWVIDRLRCRIIRALIESIREFLKIKNAKIIIALRHDLIERVIRDTRNAGFQEEKYTDLYLNVRWSKKQLLELLDRRIAKLVREQYTSHIVDHLAILPSDIDGFPIDEFLVSRTHNRPRDIILFFNRCIESSVELAGGNPAVTANIVKEADIRHSRDRLRSLGDEWTSLYPRLLESVGLLKKRKSRFRLKEIEADAIEELALRLCTCRSDPHSVIERRARGVLEGVESAPDFAAYLVRVWFQVGLIGVKSAPFEAVSWSFLGRTTLASTEVSDETIIEIHPMFWRILGTLPVDGRAKA